MPYPAAASDLGPDVIVGIATSDGMTYRQGDRTEHRTDAEWAEFRRKVRGDGEDFRSNTASIRSNVVSYLQFLRALLALGPNLPQVFTRFQRLMEEVISFYEFVRGLVPSGEAAMRSALPPVTPEEIALEKELMTALAAEGGGEELQRGILDSGFLRRAFTFLVENPTYWTWILPLLLSAKPQQ